MSSQTPDIAGPDAVLAVRLPSPLRDRFKEVAERNHRTMSGEVRHLIEERVAEAASSSSDEQAA